MAELPPPRATGTPAKPVTLTGRLLAWDGRYPVLLNMPGSPCLYVACFRSQDELRQVYARAGVAFATIKMIDDETAFLSSFEGSDVVVITDLRFTPEGRVRFLQVNVSA